MKRLGTAILAVLVLLAGLAAGASAAVPQPLTVKLFDPFYPLVARRYGRNRRRTP